MTQRRKPKGLKNSYLCVCVCVCVCVRVCSRDWLAKRRPVMSFTRYFMYALYIYDNNVGGGKTTTKYNSSGWRSGNPSRRLYLSYFFSPIPRAPDFHPEREVANVRIYTFMLWVYKLTPRQRLYSTTAGRVLTIVKKNKIFRKRELHNIAAGCGG